MQQKATVEQIQKFIEEKFTDMLMRPGKYGDIFSVEARLVNLLEIWGLIQDPGNGSFAVRNLWEQQIAESSLMQGARAYQGGDCVESWRNYMAQFQINVGEMFVRHRNAEIGAGMPREVLVAFMEKHATEALELEKDPEY